jgi:hypothetical protein
MGCQLTTFCTGTPGAFRLRFCEGPRRRLQAALGTRSSRGRHLHPGFVRSHPVVRRVSGVPAVGDGRWMVSAYSLFLAPGERDSWRQPGH